MQVYLLYADNDPDVYRYLEEIKGKPIVPLRCCNIQTKDHLRYNTSGLCIDQLPILVCRHGQRRWQVPWESRHHILLSFK